MNKQSTILKSIRNSSFMNSIIRFFRIISFEGFVWISALIYLAFFNNPFHQHFTVCPLANAGFNNCPGCGLGNSISLLLNGHFIESFNSHIFGVPALIILLFRILSLINFNMKIIKSSSQSRSSYA